MTILDGTKEEAMKFEEAELVGKSAPTEADYEFARQTYAYFEGRQYYPSKFNGADRIEAIAHLCAYIRESVIRYMEEGDSNYSDTSTGGVLITGHRYSDGGYTFSYYLHIADVF